LSRSELKARPRSLTPKATDVACGQPRQSREPHPAALRYWNITRQRHYHSSARYCAARASLPTLSPGIVPKLAESPGFVTNGGEIRRETDSLLEGDGFELPVPREKGWSFDGSLSSAPFKSLRVSTKTTRFLREGPMVRILLPSPQSLSHDDPENLRQAERHTRDVLPAGGCQRRLIQKPAGGEDRPAARW